MPAGKGEEQTFLPGGLGLFQSLGPGPDEIGPGNQARSIRIKIDRLSFKMKEASLDPLGPGGS